MVKVIFVFEKNENANVRVLSADSNYISTQIIRNKVLFLFY